MMKYHAPTNKLVVDLDALRYVSLELLNSMKYIRHLAGLPLEPYKRDSILTDADYAQKNIIDAAERLGIDLGARWGNEIDLRDPVQA
jgi:hypothetical protein